MAFKTLGEKTHYYNFGFTKDLYNYRNHGVSVQMILLHNYRKDSVSVQMKEAPNLKLFSGALTLLGFRVH